LQASVVVGTHVYHTSEDGVPFVPTGGFGIDDIGAYLAAGAACVGMGTTLTDAGPPRSGDDLNRIRDRAAAAVSAARDARPEPR